MSATVMICDDEGAIAWSLRKAIEKRGHRAAVAASAEEALRQTSALQPDVIFLDIRLPGLDGLSAMAGLKAAAPKSAIVVMTAHGNLGTAVKAVEQGAFDYLAKPFDLDQAMDAFERATAKTESPSVAIDVDSSEELVGHCPAMQHVFKRIALVAPTKAGVLITGESGTGKELVARAIHRHSPRRAKPFLPVHIAALNPNLVESELFGHVRGAFTGADRPRPGLLALADGGTVFLDELGDIPPAVQAKLLRVLERQEVIPVGGAESQTVDVRIVSATNADLTEAVAKQTFRHDLYYRLNVYPIHLPPLRERPGDIEQLARHFLAQFAAGSALPEDVLAELQHRRWPGNVRELRNALEHAAILARGGPIRIEHLPAPSAHGGPLDAAGRLDRAVREWLGEATSNAAGEPADLHQKVLDVIEPALVGGVLERLDSNRLVAARWLGLARATVRKLIKKHRLEGDAPDDESDE